MYNFTKLAALHGKKIFFRFKKIVLDSLTQKQSDPLVKKSDENQSNGTKMIQSAWKKSELVWIVALLIDILLL